MNPLVWFSLSVCTSARRCNITCIDSVLCAMIYFVQPVLEHSLVLTSAGGCGRSQLSFVVVSSSCALRSFWPCCKKPDAEPLRNLTLGHIGQTLSAPCQ